MKRPFDAPPSTHLIKSWRDDTTISLETLVNELVDNSFDWGATEVKIVVYENKDNGNLTGIEVLDNGTGIEDIIAAVTYGNETADPRYQRLGRFGIALKKGPARIGRILEIDTVNSKEHIKLTVDWPHLLAIGKWSFDPDVEDVSRGTPTYTKVRIRGAYKHRLRAWQSLREKLSVTFAPALQSGRKISICDQELTYEKTSGLTDVIDTDVTAGSRRFHILAGLMEQGKKAIQGFSLAYGHRVVIPKWTPGILAECATTRFHAEITLLDGPTERTKWTLNNFKNDIEADERDELESALAQVLAPLLDKLKAASRQLQVKSIEILFEQILNSPTGEESTKGPKPFVPWIFGTGQGQKRRKRKKDKGERNPKGKSSKANPYVKFRLMLEENPQSENLYVIDDCEGTIVFKLNLSHPNGSRISATPGELFLTMILSVASFLTKGADYKEKYPFLLNGTSDPHEAMTQNVSRWLRLGARLTEAI